MSNQTRKSCRTAPNLHRRRLSLAGSIALIGVLSVTAAVADQLCFNQITAAGSPPNWGEPPLIDGSIRSGDPRCFNYPTLAQTGCNNPDFGWANSFNYIFNNPDGPQVPDVTVLGIRDSTHLYLAVEANNTTPTGGGSTDPNNAIVVGIDPDNTHTKMQWLVIFPVPLGAANGNKQNAQFVDYYWNQTSLSSPVTSASNYSQNPGWLLGSSPGSPNAACGTPGTTCIQSDMEGASWSTEMALPISGKPSDANYAAEQANGLTLPSTGFYGLYIDVLRVVNGQWEQASWPASAAIPGCAANASCYLDTSLPQSMSGQPSGWGNGSIDPNPSPSCSGVSIGSQNLDISVTNGANPNPGNNALDASGPNVFHANVHNTGTATANNIGIIFSIANFGLPGPQSWQQVAQSQPVGASSVPVGGATLNSNSWTPPAGQYGPSNAHQCILATLGANPPNSTFFVSATAVQNMNFFNASHVERTAEVSSKGYPVNPAHNLEQEFDISVISRQSVLNPCTNSERDKNTDCTPVSQLIETAEACRHTGFYLDDKNKHKVELCQPVGSFSFVAKHPGAVTNWTFGLSGPGLEKPGNQGVYHLKMPNNSSVVLTNVVEANEATAAVCGATKSCGHAGSGGAFILLGGIFGFGLLLYRPRKKRE